MADAPDADLDPMRIDANCRDQILVCGGVVGLDAVRRAQEVGAAGVIGGGIRDQDLRELLGFDLGVAITGTEELGLSLIVTEGFGRIAMARKTFDILTENAGRTASISGATQIRAGVVRPEIIITDTKAQAVPTAAPEGAQGLAEGAVLRAIRAPYFGKIGQVLSLPAELEQVESGARVRVLEVAFEDGTRAILPRANVELIEE